MSDNSSGWVNEIMTVCTRGGAAVTPSRSGNMNFSRYAETWGAGESGPWRFQPTTISNNISHTHTFDTSEVGNDESRPNNFTSIIWKRII